MKHRIHTKYAYRRLTIRLFLFIAILASTGCSPDFKEAEQQLVVEGWIESGKFPKVKLTYTVPVSDEWQELSNLNNYIEKWAKVSINDGERTEVLVGHIDDNEFPSYVYTTSGMRGVTGHTYRLTVECPNGIIANAVTTIPEPVTIERFESEPIDVKHEKFRLYGHISPLGIATNECYKLFTRVHGEPYNFRSAYMGLINKTHLSTKRRVAINKGQALTEKDFEPYFLDGDTVTVKFAHIEDKAYTFWRDFEDMIGLSRNPLFPMTKNIHSNIQGGMGYWFGYGITTYTIAFGPDGFTLLKP